MSAREEIETNRLLKGLLDREFEKLIEDSPEQKLQMLILDTLLRIEQHLAIVNDLDLN